MKRLIFLFLVLSQSVYSQWSYVYDLGLVGFSFSTHYGYSCNDIDFFNDSVGFITNNKYLSPSGGYAWDYNRTTNYGKTWANTFSTVGQYSSGHLQVINKDTAYMTWRNNTSSSGGIQFSFNKGLSWANAMVTPGVSNFHFFDFNNGFMLIPYNGPYGSILRCNYPNTKITYTLTNQATSNICSVPPSNGFMVCNYKDLAGTVDSGYTWTSVLNKSYNLNHVVFADANTGYIACDSGKVLKTINGGAFWAELNTGFKYNLKYMSLKNDSISYCATTGGIVIKTFDGGLNWKRDSLPTTADIRKIIVKNKKVYALDMNSKLFISDLDTCGIKQSVSLTLPSYTVCYNSTLNLSGSPSGGIFNGPGVNGAVFYPSQLPGPPFSMISYTYKDPLKGCYYSDTKNITVDPGGPPITATPVSQTICLGENVTFSVSGGMTPTYTWSSGGGNGSTATYIPLSNSTYSVFYSWMGGCLFTETVSVIVDPCVGINELTKDNSITVSPNPNHGIFSVDVKQETEIVLYNNLGALVFNKKVKAGKSEIDIRNFANGMYYLRVVSNNISRVVKLVKEN